MSDFWEKLIREENLDWPDYVTAERFWEGQSRDFLMPDNVIELGRDTEDFSTAYIRLGDPWVAMFISGQPGMGKSKLMECLGRQIIDYPTEVAFVVLDPHEELYQGLRNYCSYRKLEERTVLFDPAREDYLPGYNPLRPNHIPIPTQIDMKLQAFLKVTGEEPLEKAWIYRWTKDVLTSIREREGILQEAEYLLDYYDNTYRKVLIKQTTARMVLKDWKWFSDPKVPLREKQARVDGTETRLRRFLDHPTIARIINQKERQLDLVDIITNGKILLCNFKQRGTNSLTEEGASILGTLLLDDIVETAFYLKKPVVIMVDEFQYWVKEDIGVILNEGRKHGLKMIFGCQYPGQIELQNENIFRAVLNNSQIKVIFGGLDFKDLYTLARNIYTGHLDPQRRKLEIKTKYYPPIKTREKVYTRGRHWSKSEGSSWGTTASVGTTRIPVPGFLEPDKVSYHEAEVSSEASFAGSSWGGSEVESDIPWYDYEEKEQLSSVQFYSIDEQLEEKIAELHKQPQRQMTVELPGHEIRKVKVPYIDDKPDNEAWTKAALARDWKTIKEIDGERSQYLKILEAEARAQIEPPKRRRKKLK